MASRHHATRWERSRSSANGQGYQYRTQAPQYRDEAPVSPISPIFGQGSQGSQGYYQTAQDPYYSNQQSVGVEPPPYSPPAYPGHSNSVSGRGNGEYQLAVRGNANGQVARREDSNYGRRNEEYPPALPSRGKAHNQVPQREESKYGRGNGEYPPAVRGNANGQVASREDSGYGRDNREYPLAVRSNANNQLASREDPNYPVSRYNSTEDELNPEDAAILEETTAWIPQAPTNPKVGTAELKKPVVIPRIDSVGKMTTPLPFLRAYSPALEAFGISETDFLHFIDNLAMAQTPPATIQAMEVAGAAIGFVPLPPAMFIGMALETGAVAGYYIAYKHRTKSYFKKVNKEFFAPRGLQASIVKNKDMPGKIGYDKGLPDLMPVRPGTGFVSRRVRRMQILAPYVAPITEDVPPPIKQRGLIDKWARYQVDRKIKGKDKKHRKKAAKMRSKEASLKPDSEKKKEQEQASRRNSWSSTSSIYSTDSEDEDAASTKSEHWRIQQINREADRDLKKVVGSRPKEVKAIEEWRKKELKKADKEIIKEDKKAGKTEKKDGKKKAKKFKADLKRAERFEFIVIEKLQKTSKRR